MVSSLEQDTEADTTELREATKAREQSIGNKRKDSVYNAWKNTE